MREKWIDNVKLIGIYLVVLGHFQLSPPFANSFIYAFHMPLFFLIAGIVHKPVKEQRQYVKKNFRHLILPYIYFYLITFIIQLLLDVLSGNHESNGMIKIVLGLLLGVGYSTDISVSINHPLWFLVALFFVRIFYGFIEKWTKARILPIIIIVSAMIVLVVFLKLHNIDLWFSLDSAALALPFYFFGVELKRWIKPQLIFINRYINISAFLVFAALTFLIVKTNGAVDINSSNWGTDIFLFYLAGITGTFMVISASFMFNFVDIPVLNFIAENTVIIMCLQVVIKSAVFIAAKMIGYPIFQPTALLLAVLLSGLILTLSLIPISIINKYAPFLTGKDKTIQKRNTLYQEA